MALPQLSQRLHEPTDIPSRFTQPVEGGTYRELHRLSEPLYADGREFVECSCGWTAEIFRGVRPSICAVEDAWADWSYACARLFEQNVARTIRDGLEAERELFGLLGIRR